MLTRLSMKMTKLIPSTGVGLATRYWVIVQRTNIFDSKAFDTNISDTNIFEKIHIWHKSIWHNYIWHRYIWHKIIWHNYVYLKQIWYNYIWHKYFRHKYINDKVNPIKGSGKPDIDWSSNAQRATTSFQIILLHFLERWAFIIIIIMVTRSWQAGLYWIVGQCKL